jgi:hypothetical protein
MAPGIRVEELVGKEAEAGRRPALQLIYAHLK